MRRDFPFINEHRPRKSAPCRFQGDVYLKEFHISNALRTIILIHIIIKLATKAKRACVLIGSEHRQSATACCWRVDDINFTLGMAASTALTLA